MINNNINKKVLLSIPKKKLGNEKARKVLSLPCVQHTHSNHDVYQQSADCHHVH